MQKIRYQMKAPDSVQQISEIFKSNLKRKIGPLFKLEKPKKESHCEEVITLVFFPVVSRTGTDIDAAVKDIKDNKPTLLVVLHHTFDPQCIVSDSSKFVDRTNTLVVDCLFFEDKGLLECKKNEKAYEDAIKWLKSQKRRMEQEKKGKKGTNASHDQKSPKTQAKET